MRTHSIMAYCPNCNVSIVSDAEDCDVCGTSFGSDTWLPLDMPPSQQRRHPLMATLVFRAGVLAVLLPLAGLVLGLLIVALVPGCGCDDVLGCQGCGADGVTALLLRGGHDGGMLAILFIFPAAALLAGALSWWARHHR